MFVGKMKFQPFTGIGYAYAVLFFYMAILYNRVGTLKT
jgi:hypothetical protein